MATISATLAYVSKILGDQQSGREFKVYTKDFLREAMEEALAIIVSDLPDLLAYETTMTLVEGTLQQSACPGGTTELLEGNATEVESNAVGSNVASILLSKCGAGGFKPQHYANVAGGNHVKLQPSVPADKAGATLRVLCKGKVPPTFNVNDSDFNLLTFPAEAVQIINDWMLYRAYLTDDQNIHSNAEADRLYVRLSRRLGTEFKMRTQERRDLANND